MRPVEPYLTVCPPERLPDRQMREYAEVQGSRRARGLEPADIVLLVDLGQVLWAVCLDQQLGEAIADEYWAELERELADGGPA